MSISGSKASSGVTKAEFNPVKNDVTQLKSDIIAVNQRIDVLGGTTEYDTLSAQINSNAQSISNLQTSVTNIQQDVTDLSTSVDNNIVNIANLQNGYNSLSTQINDNNVTIQNTDMLYYFKLRQINDALVAEVLPRSGNTYTKFKVRVNDTVGTVDLLSVEGNNKRIRIGEDGTTEATIFLNGLVSCEAGAGAPVKFTTIRLTPNTGLSNGAGMMDYNDGGLYYHNGTSRVQLQDKITAATNISCNTLTSSTLGVSGTSTLTGNTTIGGTLGVTGACTLSTVNASGNSQVTGTSRAARFLSTGATDNAIYPLNLTTSFNAGEEKYLVFGRNYTVGDLAEICFRWEGTNNPSNMFSFGFLANKVLRVYNNNRVGINNGSPSVALDVTGAIKSSDGVILTNTTNHGAGKLRWNGNKVQVSDGTNWQDVGIAIPTDNITLSNTLQAHYIDALTGIYSAGNVTGKLAPVPVLLSNLTELDNVIVTNSADGTVWIRENSVNRPLRSRTPRMGRFTLVIQPFISGGVLTCTCDGPSRAYGEGLRVTASFEDSPWRIKYLFPKDIPGWDKNKVDIRTNSPFIRYNVTHPDIYFNISLVDEDGDYKKIWIEPSTALNWLTREQIRDYVFDNHQGYGLFLDIDILDYNYY